ncbi:MAG: RnfABCDGE type electron transport complex subunit D [Phycisphaerae bacterium]|nr:RnfABCDGE type electron transport complex subunit D [Phycisphaerae bacterium]
MLSKITVSHAPHIAKSYSTQSIMLDVILALCPAMLAGMWFFRHYAVVLLVACIGSCMLTEWACNWIRRKSNTLDDFSAIVTGILLAMSLPPALPFWAGIIGSVFAIAVGKMVFGGLGCNVFNPAMIGRAFLTASFGTLMTTWTVPAPLDAQMPALRPDSTVAVTQATPLAWSKEAIKGKAEPSVVVAQRGDAFIGRVGGCLGETSALAMLIGGVYLLIRGTISWHIPVSVLLAATICAAIGWLINPDRFVSPEVHILAGGMLMGVFFIATDPVTAPLTGKGMLIFGMGVGALTMLIRMVGEYPEGVMYAVLIMNAFTPLIDRFCKRIPAGGKGNG